uniref:Acyl CoA synthetase n=1 Tax=Watasenia scintillans TaxID=6625 RepID=A0A346DKM1_WATSC|nr:luciferase-like protein 3 [Watasenia scintillans]BBB86723.1 acyl CoA synthetase [Watasenia scintillans]
MKSYFHNPRDFTFVYETLPDRMKKLAQEKPNKVAVVMYYSERDRFQITRKELYDKAVKFARALMKLGLKKGERVAFCASNSINWLAYDLGIIIAGGISVHLLMGEYDIKFALAGCSFVVLEKSEHWDDLLAVAEIAPGGLITSESFPSLKLGMSVSASTRPGEALLISELLDEVDKMDSKKYTNFPFVDPEDFVFTKQTSGTTGIPKRVKHTHFNVMNCPQSYGEMDAFTDSDVRFNSRHMAYTVGYPFDLFTTGLTHVSGCPTFLNDYDNLDYLVKIWRQEGCTILDLPPNKFSDLRGFDCRVKTIDSTGDLLTKEMIDGSLSIAETMIVAYSSVEALNICHRVFKRSNLHEHIDGMLGRPSQGVEVKIVDEFGAVVEQGMAGVVYVRCPWMSTGYWDIGTVRPHGWLETSDVAIMLPEGDLILKGKTTEFILRGELKLLTQFVESYVDRHQDVNKTVAVNIPDANGKDNLCCCVQTYPGQKLEDEALLDFCMANMHDKYVFEWLPVIPKYFLEFEEFPELLTGKIDKMKTREIAIERLKATKK